MSEIQSFTARVLWLSNSVDRWNAGMISALVVAAIAALFIVLTTRMVVFRSKQLATAQGLLSDAKDRQSAADSKAKDEKIADANKAAGEANVKAEKFRLDIAKANESAAEAQAQVAGATAEAARANLELAKLKTPRTLSPEQQARISARIVAFPDTPYDLWVSTDSDSTALMELIDTAVRAGKWKFQKAGVIQFAGKAGIMVDSGVSIRFDSAQRARLEPPALALANALVAEGIPVKGVFTESANDEQDEDKSAIHVRIGSKPLN